MAEIEETTDNDISEVAESKTKFGEIEEETRPVAMFFSLLTAEKLMGIFDAAPKKAPLAAEKMEGKSPAQLKRWRAEVAAFEAASAFQLALEGTFGDPVRIAAGESRIAPPDLALQIALLPEDENEAEPQLFPQIAVDDRRRVLADRLVNEARARAARHGFFHWEIGFPNVWLNLLSASPRGGFDAVIGNPPYVRQELLGDEIKRALRAGYTAYDGMADLYVFFFEQGLRLLRPGGRLSYVITNKWLRAGYTEALRDLLATTTQVEFIADFGHAKHFFPDADVFPSVVTVRKLPTGEDAAGEAQVCIIPRDAVPEKGLAVAVANTTYSLPRACFSKSGWTLEPLEVIALIEKMRRYGVPLAEYTGVTPFRGVLTGFNEAFVIDGATRERLIREDPRSGDIIRPYLRGQDIDRWASEWAGQWMIFTRHGIDMAAYPAIKAHLAQFRKNLEPRPTDWRPTEIESEWPGRKPGPYRWYEIQDNVAYFMEFAEPKIIYQEIQYYARFSLDLDGILLNNKAFFIKTDDKVVVASLNSPLLWWFNWRHLVHGKDEALNAYGIKMEQVPIAPMPDHEAIVPHIDALCRTRAKVHQSRRLIADWYRHSLGIENIPSVLRDPFQLSSDQFVSAIGKARGNKKALLSGAEIGAVRQEYTRTVEPIARRLLEALQHERAISDLVNAAYGLTLEDVALMWRTAPPRMPLDPKEELRRLGFTN
jgi:hypothetical protein